MSRQFSGLPFLSDRCWRAHTFPDPETFSISQSISKQKFTSPLGLSFQALSPHGNWDVSVEGRATAQEAPNHSAALQQHPKETFRSRSAVQYHCSLSLLFLLQFIHCIQKQQHKVHSKRNILSFYFFLRLTHKVFELTDLESAFYLSTENARDTSRTHNLSSHWNWPRGDALDTGRFLTPPRHSWRLTQWFIATNKSQRQSTLALLEAQDWLMPSLKAGEIWEVLMSFPVLSLSRWTTLLSLWLFSLVIRLFTQSQLWFHCLPNVKCHLFLYSITKKYL